MSGSKHRRTFQAIDEKTREKLGDSLKKLILYGSVARNQESEISDLDLLAVVEDREQKAWLQQKAAEIGVENGVLVSIIVKTEEEYESFKDTSFGQEVRETGEIHV
jgi:predicted nucleotidyltransferase